MSSRNFCDQPQPKKRKIVDHDTNRGHFDFVIAERPKYIPGSGPPLGPLSIMPPHDKDGIILDYLVVDGAPQYLVGYKTKPYLQIGVKPQNIQDWCSARTIENWEFEQTNLRLQEEEERLLPKIIAKEERRRKREEKLAGKGSREKAPKRYWSRKRKRPATPEPPPRRPLARGMGMAIISDEKATAHGPARRRGREKVEEPTSYTSPLRPQDSRPSLSTPSKGRSLADRIVTETDTDEEGTDAAINRQLGITSDRMKTFSSLQIDSSRSTSTSPSLLARKPSTPPKLVSKATSTSRMKPRREFNLPSVQPPGNGAVAATSSREALKIYENLEKKKSSPKTGAIYQKYSMFAATPTSKSPCRSLSSSSVHKSKASPSRREETLEVEEDGEEKDDEDTEYKEAWEVEKILDQEVRVENGKKKLYYYVDWVGDWDPSWEPSENVEAPEVLAAYKRAKKFKLSMAMDGADESTSDEVMMVNTSGNSKSRGEEDERFRAFENVARASERVAWDGYDTSEGEEEETDEDTLFVSERQLASRRGEINDKGNGKEIHSREVVHDDKEESD